MESNKQGHRTMWSGVRGGMTICDTLLNVMVNKMTQRARCNRIWSKLKINTDYNTTNVHNIYGFGQKDYKSFRNCLSYHFEKCKSNIHVFCFIS